MACCFVNKDGATGAEGPTGPTGPTGPAGTVPPLSAVASTNVGAQTPAANGPLTFDSDQATTGTAITHTPNSETFTLTENGLYEIHYNTVGTNANTVTPPTSLGTYLANGGTAIPGTTSTATIGADGNTATLSGSTVVNVTSAPADITLAAENANGSYSNSALTIRKLS